MAHQIIRVKTKSHYARAKCKGCLRYAATAKILRGLWPRCTRPTKKRTKFSQVFALDYGINRNGRREKQYWHSVCRELLISCGQGRYTCPCGEYSSEILGRSLEKLLICV